MYQVNGVISTDNGTEVELVPEYIDDNLSQLEPLERIFYVQKRTDHVMLIPRSGKKLLKFLDEMNPLKQAISTGEAVTRFIKQYCS